MSQEQEEAGERQKERYRGREKDRGEYEEVDTGQSLSEMEQ